MNKILDNYKGLLMGLILILLIVVMDKNNIFDESNKKIYAVILLVIFLIILIIILDKVIRIFKLKKVNKKDLNELDKFYNMKLNNSLKEDEYINDFHYYLCSKIKMFKKMNKNIDISEEYINMNNTLFKKSKNKIINEYLIETDKIYKIIFKYYDKNGKRKI